MEEPNSFEKNIFINCPFDNEYKQLFRPLVFTCIYCGLNPQVAQLQDAGRARLGNIIQLIKNSKFSVHDISRVAVEKDGDEEYARFNMPLELGIVIGLKNCQLIDLKETRALVIDTHPHRYLKSMSDLAGSDIASYGKDERQSENIVKGLRDWFVSHINPKQFSAKLIWAEFNEFLSDLSDILKKFNRGITVKIEDITVIEFIYYAKEWVKARIQE